MAAWCYDRTKVCTCTEYSGAIRGIRGTAHSGSCGNKMGTIIKEMMSRVPCSVNAAVTWLIVVLMWCQRQPGVITGGTAWRAQQDRLAQQCTTSACKASAQQVASTTGASRMQHSSCTHLVHPDRAAHELLAIHALDSCRGGVSAHGDEAEATGPAVTPEFALGC